MSFSAKPNSTCLRDLSNAFYWIILLPSDKQSKPEDKHHPSSAFFLKITPRLYNPCLLSINEFLFQHLRGWEDCKCVIKKKWPLIAGCVAAERTLALALTHLGWAWLSPLSLPWLRPWIIKLGTRGRSELWDSENCHFPSTNWNYSCEWGLHITWPDRTQSVQGKGVNLERLRLNEMIQTQKDKSHFLSHMCPGPECIGLYTWV